MMQLEHASSLYNNNGNNFWFSSREEEGKYFHFDLDCKHHLVELQSLQISKNMDL